jgi:aerobic carbon-monoxide dehydrogenase medium subunit
MTPFELSEPTSLKEALSLLDADDPSVRPASGCTALMLMMKAGVFHPTRLVSLRKVAGMSGIKAGGDGSLTIGAMTPLAALEHSAEVAKLAPVITRTMPRLSNVRVRNVATVGGALAHGDPHMDLPPVLIALGASVKAVSPKGERTLKVEDLLTGYYETALEKNELIAEVHIPAQGARRAAYMKFTAGSAEDWPAVGVAVSLDAAGDTLRDAIVVASAATTKATRLKSAEDALRGARIDDASLKGAGEAGAAEADIIADVRGSVAYKRELIRVHIARAIRQALGEKSLAANGAH